MDKLKKAKKRETDLVLMGFRKSREGYKWKGYTISNEEISSLNQKDWRERIKVAEKYIAWFS